MSRDRAQIVERKYGFLIRVYLGTDPQTGKRLYHNEKVRSRNKTEAKKVKTALLRKLDIGELATEQSNQSLKDYLEEWLITAAKPKLEPSTYDDYCYNLKRYIYKPIGNIKLTKLEPRMIQKVYTGMLETLSARTIRYTHTIIVHLSRRLSGEC